MNVPPFTDVCGRLYDPRTDSSTTDYPCDNPARWDIVPVDGIHRYACGWHINTVLSDLVSRQMTDVSIKDLRE
jgi:hypothetical protein